MEKESWCYYSDLPSPNAYVDDTDYDGMGNHNRMGKVKKVNKTWGLRGLILKILKKSKKL